MVTFVESSITRDYKGVWEVLILMQYYPGELEGLVPVRARGEGGGSERYGVVSYLPFPKKIR